MISFHNRNSPCQACRRSRRKCLPGTDGNDGGPCGRCERLKFECVHEAPSLKGVAKLDETEEDEIVEKAQMIEDVAELQRQLASLEKEVQTMRVVTDADFPPLVPLEELAGWPSMEIDIPSSPWSSDLTISEVSEDDGDTSHNIAWSPQSTLINSPTITAVSPHQPSPTWTFQNAHYHNWKVTLRPQGLRIHTNIRSFQDLMDFALVNTDHMRADDPENPLSSAYLNRFHRPLQKVTMTDFPLEDSSAWIFLKVLDRRKADQALPIEIIRAGIENTVAGLLYNAYFACLNLYRPLFYRPTFTRDFYYAQDPSSSPIVCAMGALMAGRQCEHVVPLFRGLGMNGEVQRRLAHHFADRARELLGDSFDEPSLANMITLMMLVEHDMVTLDASKGWLYATIAMAMAEELKPRYGTDPGAGADEDARARYEMFKRSYYDLCLTGIKFRFLRDYVSNYVIVSPRVDVHVLGPVRPLPEEDTAMARCVEVYRLYLELADYHDKAEFDDLRYIFVKLPDRLSMNATTLVDDCLYRWYAQLPTAFRVTPNVFQYPSPEELEMADPCALSLLLCFYACWIVTHSHFIPTAEAGTTGEGMGEGEDRDPDTVRLAVRSLTICMRSANIAMLVGEHLFRKWFCQLDSHMLIHACDVLNRMANSKDARLAAMGRQNLNRMFKIVKASVYAGAGPGKEAGVGKEDAYLSGLVGLVGSLGKNGVRF